MNLKRRTWVSAGQFVAVASVWILLFSSVGHVVGSDESSAADSALPGVDDKPATPAKKTPWDLSVRSLPDKSGGFGFSASARDFTALFRDGTGNGSQPVVSIEAESYQVGYAPRSMAVTDQTSPQVRGVSNVSADARGATVAYTDALGDGVSVAYEMAINGLKETFTVDERPDQKGDLTVHGALFYDTSKLAAYVDGVKVNSTASTGETMELRDSNGKAVFVIPKGWARDSSTMQVESDPGLRRAVSSPRWSEVTFKVERYGDLTFFDVVVPASYLQNSSTTFPVFIDPSLGPTIADSQEYDNVEITQTSGLTILTGGTLILRNSTFVWDTDDSLVVGEHARFVFDNSTMGSSAPESIYEIDAFGDLSVINSQIGGRIRAFLVTPPSSAGLDIEGSNFSGVDGDCLMLGGQITPITISGARFSDCAVAGLRLASPQNLANTWSITDTTFEGSLYGLFLQAGDFHAATFQGLTATGNRIAGFTASNARATISNCVADRNGRGWVALTNSELTVQNCSGEGNAAGAYAVGATIYLDLDFITNSSDWDLYCSSSTCDPTGGNSGNWVTLSQNSNLTYRHVLNLRVVDAATAPLSNYWVFVSDRYGNPGAAQAQTNSTGWVTLTVADRRVQPDDSLTFYTPHTIHLGISPMYNVTTVIDSDWNLTLYATGDADNDSVPDAIEGDANVLWFAATNHVNDPGQLTPSGNIGRPAIARDENGSFLKEGSFPGLPAGVYRLGVEAWTNESGAPIVIRIEDQVETELLGDTSFALNASTAWYLTPEFELGAGDRPTLLVSDPDMRAAGAILLSTILLERIVNETNVNTTARPGMATNVLDPDTDRDGAPDGVERRNTTFWQEAEAVGYGSFNRVLDQNASSGAAAEHAVNESKVVETAFDDLVAGHNYTLWVRARAMVNPGSSEATFFVADSSTDYTTTIALAGGYEWLEGPTVAVDSGGTLVIRVLDIDDPDFGDATSYIRVDAMLLADLTEVNQFGLFSNPLQRDTDFDREWDGPELGGFFTADFVNASEGTRSYSTDLSGRSVVFDNESDWLNVTVPVRYEGDYRFQILPGIFAADANADGRLDQIGRLLRATLTDANNTEIASVVNFTNIYFGSSAPPTLQNHSMQQLEGWYSWIFANLNVGTYHLKLWVNTTEAVALPGWVLYLDRVYIQKQSLDPLDRDFENDSVIDGEEVERGTFPLNPDSDYDHLTDFEEIYLAADGYLTNPLLNDTDADGLPDAVEVGIWGDSNTNTTTDPTKLDTDGDGLPDGWIDGWSYGRDVKGDPSAISRKDGIKQPWEGEDLNLDGAVDTSAFSVNRSNNATSTGGETDPSDRDTDGDGMPDGWELWIADFNTSGHPWGNDPLILDPRFNDSELDADVNRSTYDGQPDKLTNLQEYLAGTLAFFDDTDQDWIVDGDEANVSLRTNVGDGFANSTRFQGSTSSTWVFFDKNPYDSVAGKVYWWNSTGTNVTETYPGSLFFGGRLLHTIADGGAVLYNPTLDRIYVWEAGSEYAYTGSDQYHNGTVHEFLNGTTGGVNTNVHTQRGYEHQEFLGDLNPLVRDSDRDGIIDGDDGPVQGNWVRWFEDRDADGLINALDTDSDADGRPDGSETPAGGPEFNPASGYTNAYDPDTDHDGVSDANDTRALDFDNDGETGYGGFTDAWGSWPSFAGAEGAYFNAILNRTLAWDNPDSDGDGIPDGVEDLDHNGHWDAGETNALDADTDDDGLWDGPDVYYGAPTLVEAEGKASNSSGAVVQAGFGASGGSSLNWTGYLETATWSLSLGAAYYRLELALADDAAPSNTSILGRNVTVEIYLDGTLLNIAAVSINASVHLPSVFLVAISPLPIWNASSHTLTITVVRGDADYRFHLDYLRLSTYHPGEWNASSGALRNDSDGDGVHDGAERGLIPAITAGNNSSALGTDSTKFVAPPYLALSSAAATDSDGDGLPDGYRDLVNSTRIEAEAGAYANSTPYNEGGVIGVTTQTTTSGNASIWFTRYLEPGYYELTGHFNKAGCQAPPNMSCSGPFSYRTEVLLSGQVVGRANVSLPDSGWYDRLAGAFFVRQPGAFEVRVLERYSDSYNYRLTVDYFTLNFYAVGERALGSNPRDPDTDRDLISDGAEFLRMTDPLKVDTDGEGLPDSQEAPFFGDFDGSAWNESLTGYVNYTDAHDVDRDGDNWTDGDVNESTVVFRTNASRGMYNEMGVWVAVDLNGTGTLMTFVYDAALSINYSNTTAVKFRTRLGGNVTRNTTTPEGYALFKNGSWVFIDLPGAMDVRFVASSAGIPGNATTNTTIAYYMLALRESLNWSLMLDTDPDDDGLIGADDPCPFVFDCDGDGMGDGEERANSTNITNPDSDGDGLWDGPTVGAHIGEWVNGSNPRLNDTDKDGLLDGPWNAATGQLGEFNFTTDPTQWDTDGDGMPDLWEIVNGLNATNATDGWLDKDKDGLNNTMEYSYGRPFVRWEEANGTWWNGTNVSFWDTDFDFMPDGWEVQNATDPKNGTDASTDPDLDNLTALQEYRLGRPGDWNETINGIWWNGSRPRTNDTDGDGISDWDEWNVSDRNPDHDTHFNWNDSDSDNDALNDSFENAGWYILIAADGYWWNFTGRNESANLWRRVSSDPYDTDTDNDGVGDLAEFGSRTDPRSGDTDFDGIGDFVDSEFPMIPEWMRPQFLSGSSGPGITIRGDVDCQGDSYCEQHKGDLLGSVLQLLCLPCAGLLPYKAATTTYWLNVTVDVNDDGGLQNITVYAWRLGQTRTRLYSAPYAISHAVETFSFAMNLVEATNIASLEMFQVVVTDRNGNVAVGAARAGLLWDSERYEMSDPLVRWFVNTSDGFSWGLFQGIKEGLFMTGVGMGTGGFNLLQYAATLGRIGQAGKVAGEFFLMLYKWQTNPFGLFKEMVYSTAVSDSIILNPYTPNEADLAAFFASNATNPDPLLNHLWNATKDVICTGWRSSFCHGPGNTSQWAKFMAGHAGAAAAVELALFVLFTAGMAVGIADNVAGPRGGPGGSLRGDLDAVTRAVERVRGFFENLREDDVVAAAGGDLAPALHEIMDSNARAGVEVAPETQLAINERLGPGLGSDATRAMLDPKLGSPDPLGLFRRSGPNADGPWELIPERAADFDGAARLVGRMEPAAYRAFLGQMKGYEGFLRDGLADHFTSVEKAGQLYRLTIGSGADPSFVSRLFRGLEGGKLSPDLESFSFPKDERSFSGFKFYDDAGNEATYMFEQQAGGLLRPLGEFWDVDQGRGLTYANLAEANRGNFADISKGQWDGIRNEVLRGVEALDKAERLFGVGARVVRLANSIEGTFDYGFRSLAGNLRGALEAGEHTIRDFGGKLARGLMRGMGIDWAAGKFRIFGDDIVVKDETVVPAPKTTWTGTLSEADGRAFEAGFNRATDGSAHIRVVTSSDGTTIYLDGPGGTVQVSVEWWAPN